MENIVESILMAFAVLVLIIALSMTTYLLSTAMSTTEELVYNSDKTQYLSTIKNDITSYSATRVVGIDTVINSLYRYYKENFMVRICRIDGTVHQIFDTTIEGKVYVAASKPIRTPDIRTEEEKALIRMYGVGGVNLFGAPWMGNTNNFAKQRVDLYVSGQTGYVNNFIVDYGNVSVVDKFMNLSNIDCFEETFIEYQYSGQTISTEDGIESITGNEQAKNKIIIEYRAINN